MAPKPGVIEAWRGICYYFTGTNLGYKSIVLVKNVGQPSSHSSSYISTHSVKDNHTATSHVLATMISCAFNHSFSK
ncbi:hypothetical protein Lal_00003071 [Lupinus albus]|nr:hypothetical protein Lal_00003071 [Lupinus albus]